MLEMTFLRSTLVIDTSFVSLAMFTYCKQPDVVTSVLTPSSLVDDWYNTLDFRPGNRSILDKLVVIKLNAGSLPVFSTPFSKVTFNSGSMKKKGRVKNFKKSLFFCIFT